MRRKMGPQLYGASRHCFCPSGRIKWRVSYGLEKKLKLSGFLKSPGQQTPIDQKRSRV